MAEAIQFTLRQGNQAQHNGFTGAAGEPTYNTSTKTIHIHDGVTKGGKAVLTKSDDLTAQISAATTSLAGRVMLANNSEVVSGTDNSKVITPKTLADNLLTVMKSTLSATGAAPLFGCRAYGTFNGTNPSVVNGGNFLSVTDNGVGDYTISFRQSLGDTNYAISVTTSGGGSGNLHAPDIINKTTAGFRVKFNRDSSNAYPAYDPEQVMFAVFG